MTATISRFTTQRAPCGEMQDGERYLTEDQQGLITEELRYSCGCRSAKEEFHDGSVHRRQVHHKGRVLVDEELRGE
ncbi:MAG: hypothetical protein GEU96_09850 [Propionibacteriales bacterium]|nr:hypothetical protein [Propionibacteriales bacterium]